MKKRIYLNPACFVCSSGQVQTLQNSVMRCTRCNACLQSCPSYLIKPEETSSARGRVQLLRLILEDKIKPQQHRALIEKTLRSCLLCGKCSLACAGDIPVAQQVLALSKEMGLRQIPASLKFFYRLKNKAPRFFDFFIRSVQFLRRWKLFFLWGLPRKSSLYWVQYAHRTLPAPKRSLRRQLLKDHFPFCHTRADFMYLPSLEACYIDPVIGQKTLKILGKKKIHILFDVSSGLFEHLYGDPTRCLTQAKRLLTLWEKHSAQKVPLVTDSWEVFAFLKNYPALFASLPNWQKRAELFASQVRFVADFIKPKKSALSVKTALDSSGLLHLPLENIALAHKIIKTQAGKNLLECDYSRFPIALGGVLFGGPLPTDRMLLANVEDIIRGQIQQVYCLSGWVSFILSRALKRHAPTAQAQHIVYLQDRHD